MGATVPRTAPAPERAPAPDQAPVVVRVDDASKRFGDVAAVSHVTLQVEQGTILGLVGPSGSGKTTIVRMLTGILAPTSGRVRVLGEDPTRYRRRTRERIGYMPQHFILYPDLTAAENVSFVAALFGLYWRRRSRRVREVLELAQLWDARDRRAGQLSGGMQRRLALACALVHDPAVLFVDEPSAGIDPILRQAIWAEFRRRRDAGRTLFVTTQYVGEAEYCDRVALLAEGELVGLAAPADMRRQALGGEVIELELSRPVETADLAALGGVSDVRWTGPRTLLVVAESASEATPRVLQALAGMGGDVVRSREYRPTFDEVFAELVARHRATREEAERLGDG
ncbi:MAG TPA: ABC transporter ATP-binding protein [Chloroflexota bacterium]|nr:ABC transporter ATP-binding protein [Chloroflexota bacterium]